MSKEKNFQKNGHQYCYIDFKVINLCKNKLKTYDFLKQNKIMFPKIVKFKELKKNLCNKKEVRGNSSKNK